MSTQNTPGLHVVQNRYDVAQRWSEKADPVEHYAASGVYSLLGEPTVVEPQFPAGHEADEPTVKLGVFGGQIAEAVAAGRRAGKPVLVVGGTCDAVPGIVGGIQQAHGPAAKIGLVWFDAHGDFNTPRTTLSGMLGGMPVAVSAGLAYPEWRTLSQQETPLPTDRIVMVDVRNLDAAEEQLIRATDVTIAAPAPGFPGEDLQQAISTLAEKCDIIYLHIDADVLDGRYVPNHRTVELNGPSMEQVQAAIDTVMNTGKVAVFAVVSIWTDGEGGATAMESGTQLVRAGVEAWARQTV